MTDAPLYAADPANIFGFHLVISLALVIGGAVLFPILMRRAAGAARLGVVFACGVLFLFGLARVIVIGMALANWAHEVTAPLHINTRGNTTGMHRTRFQPF